MKQLGTRTLHFRRAWELLASSQRNGADYQLFIKTQKKASTGWEDGSVVTALAFYEACIPATHRKPSKKVVQEHGIRLQLQETLALP